MSSWLATPLSYVFNTGFRRGSAVNSQQKNPGRSRGQIASDRLAVLLLSALALSALTALLSALSGLFLVLLSGPPVVSFFDQSAVALF